MQDIQNKPQVTLVVLTVFQCYGIDYFLNNSFYSAVRTRNI